MGYPKASDPKMGLSESLYYAQVIVKAYSDAMDESNCMSKLTTVAYIEAEQFEFRIKETLRPLVVRPDQHPELEPEMEYTYVVPDGVDNRHVPDPVAVSNESVSPDQKRDWMEECFSCDIEIPEFNFDGLFGSLLEDAEAFLDDIKGLLSLNIPNMCQVAHLMSFTCIPNLIAILASILSAIIKLLNSLEIGDVSLNGFIMAVIQGIISSLLEYVLAMIAAVLSPVTCLVDSISEILDKVPSKGNAEEGLTDEQYSTLTAGTEKDNTSNSLKEAVANVGDQAEGYAGKATDGLLEGFTVVQDALKFSDDAIQGTIDDIFGLIGFQDCEPNRSGTSIGEKISAAVELVQVANLVMAMIDKKAASAATERLCNEKEKPLLSEDSELKKSIEEDDSAGFTNNEIAEVIADALGADQATIEVDEKGKGVALILKDVTKYRPKLSLYGCQVTGLTKRYTAPAIIEHADAIAEEYLIEEFGYEKVKIDKYTREDIDQMRKMGKPLFDLIRPAPESGDHDSDNRPKSTLADDINPSIIFGDPVENTLDWETPLWKTVIHDKETRVGDPLPGFNPGGSQTTPSTLPSNPPRFPKPLTIVSRQESNDDVLTEAQDLNRGPSDLFVVPRLDDDGTSNAGEFTPTPADFDKFEYTGNKRPTTNRFDYVKVDPKFPGLNRDSTDTILFLDDGSHDNGISTIIQTHIKDVQERSIDLERATVDLHYNRVPPEFVPSIVDGGKVSLDDIRSIVDKLTKEVDEGGPFSNIEEIADSVVDATGEVVVPSIKSPDTQVEERDYAVGLEPYEETLPAKKLSNFSRGEEKAKDLINVLSNTSVTLDNKVSGSSGIETSASPSPERKNKEGILRGQTMSAGIYSNPVKLRCNSTTDIEDILLGDN